MSERTSDWPRHEWQGAGRYECRMSGPVKRGMAFEAHSPEEFARKAETMQFVMFNTAMQHPGYAPAAVALTFVAADWPRHEWQGPGRYEVHYLPRPEMSLGCHIADEAEFNRMKPQLDRLCNGDKIRGAKFAASEIELVFFADEAVNA